MKPMHREYVYDVYVYEVCMYDVCMYDVCMYDTISVCSRLIEQKTRMRLIPT